MNSNVNNKVGRKSALLNNSSSKDTTPVLIPTLAQPHKPTLPSQPEAVKSAMNEWYDWLVNHVPKAIKKKTSVAFTTMKKKIMSLYHKQVEY